MRSDKELINKIIGLKEIKPREEWVVLTKKEILGWKPRISFRFVFRPAFASLVVFCIMGGVGVSAKNSIPGDLFYPVKKAGEKVIISLMPEKSKSNARLAIANDKLENIVKVVQSNQPGKIIPIVKEYQANITEAAQNIKKASKNVDVREIAKTIGEIEKNKEKLEKTYGVLLSENQDINEAVGMLMDEHQLSSIIESLENSSLSEEQLGQFEEAKKDYENKEYSKSLIKILDLSNNSKSEKEE